jgi:hypothetical protein
MVVKDYKELCFLVGEKVKNSDSKIAQIKELQRYVRLQKQRGKKEYLIMEIYLTPLHKDDSRDMYKQHIQLILLDYIARNGNTELTKAQIMNMCGLCNERYFTLQQEEYILHEDKVTEFDLKDFYRRTGLKFSEIIDVAVKGLGGSNYCYAVVRKVYKIYTNEDTFIASAEEEKIILDAKRKVLNQLGLSTIPQVFRKFKQKEFYYEVNKLLNNQYGWYRCQQVYQITPTVRIHDNLQHFIKLLDDKNKERKLLNDKVIDYFNTDAENKYQINLAERKELKDRIDSAIVEGKNSNQATLQLLNAFNFNGNYVDAQKCIAEYLLEI